MPTPAIANQALPTPLLVAADASTLQLIVGMGVLLALLATPALLAWLFLRSAVRSGVRRGNADPVGVDREIEPRPPTWLQAALRSAFADEKSKNRGSDMGPPPRSRDSAAEPTREEPEFHAYVRCRTLLSDPEQVLYGRLLRALPNHTIAVQVQMSQLIRPAEARHRQAALNRINRKSIDFVVIDPATSPVLAIELDDASHNAPDRRRADAVKDAAMKSAGVPLFRYRVESIPSEQDLVADVQYVTRQGGAAL